MIAIRPPNFFETVQNIINDLDEGKFSGTLHKAEYDLHLIEIDPPRNEQQIAQLVSCLNMLVAYALPTQKRMPIKFDPLPEKRQPHGERLRGNFSAIRVGVRPSDDPESMKSLMQKMLIERAHMIDTTLRAWTKIPNEPGMIRAKQVFDIDDKKSAEFLRDSLKYNFELLGKFHGLNSEISKPAFIISREPVGGETKYTVKIMKKTLEELREAEGFPPLENDRLGYWR